MDNTFIEDDNKAKIKEELIKDEISNLKSKIIEDTTEIINIDKAMYVDGNQMINVDKTIKNSSHMFEEVNVEPENQVLMNMTSDYLQMRTKQDENEKITKNLTEAKEESVDYNDSEGGYYDYGEEPESDEQYYDEVGQGENVEEYKEAKQVI